MKDSVTVERLDDGRYKITRTMSDIVTEKEFNERLKAITKDIEVIDDTIKNLTDNRKKLLKQQEEKMKNDVKQYKEILKARQANLKAMLDARALGKGQAETETKGSTYKGVVIE